MTEARDTPTPDCFSYVWQGKTLAGTERRCEHVFGETEAGLRLDWSGRTECPFA